MNRTRNPKRILAGALLSGVVAATGLGLSTGTAQAGFGNDPSTGVCNGLGVCSRNWCPGSSLPAPDVVWDMNVCHHYYGGTAGAPGTDGGIPVGFHILEGDPSPAFTIG